MALTFRRLGPGTYALGTDEHNLVWRPEDGGPVRMIGLKAGGRAKTSFLDDDSATAYRSGDVARIRSAMVDDYLAYLDATRGVLANYVPEPQVPAEVSG